MHAYLQAWEKTWAYHTPKQCSIILFGPEEFSTHLKTHAQYRVFVMDYRDYYSPYIAQPDFKTRNFNTVSVPKVTEY